MALNAGAIAHSASDTIEHSKNLLMSQEKLAENKETFIKLLIAQMKNQNPLEPMKTNDITAQYAQFAQVEQSLEGNKLMESMTKLMKVSQALQLTQSKNVAMEIKGSHFHSTPGSITSLGYTLPTSVDGKVARTVVTISNASGTPVRILDGATASGRHTIKWDGRGAKGEDLPPGNYRFSVMAFDSKNHPVRDDSDQRKIMTFPTTVSGRVQGTQFDKDGTPRMIMAGGDENTPTVPLSAFNGFVEVNEPVNQNAPRSLNAGIGQEELQQLKFRALSAVDAYGGEPGIAF